jgi:hypothetical protein
MQKPIIFLAFMLYLTVCAFSQTEELTSVRDSGHGYQFSLSTSWVCFTNFDPEIRNTHHYELHFKYDLTPKDKIGLKFATWALFRPMGMLMWEDGAMDIKDESTYYPGKLWETGLGFSYQRMLWKGLFTAVEILPQLKRYVDKSGDEIASGFKLYTSYHLGYHLSLFKTRVFIEPQIHGQLWPIDTNTPESFKAVDDKWHNFFIPEFNLYIGFKF